MKLSIYTCAKDAIHWDLHVRAMLKHHLPLADEIVVNEGYSTDGTFEAIKDLDPKVKVFRSRWLKNESAERYKSFKDRARLECTGDWCLHLDCDEFIPEWDFARMRNRLETTSEDLLSIEFVNFYGNYKVYHSRPGAVHWPTKKMILHRNRPDIEFWGDGSNVRVRGQESGKPEPSSEFSCHHFGYVRHASRLREKWRTQNSVYRAGRFRLPIPGFAFDLFPHRWDDPSFFDDLEPYEGPYIRAVLEDPQEFVRDGLRTYDAVRERAQRSRSSEAR